MKTILIMALMSLTTFANASHLLEKYTWYGTDDNYEKDYYERCRVFDGYMTKVVQDENGIKKYRYRATHSTAKIKALIKQARKEKLTLKPFEVCDVPETMIYAYRPGLKIRLYATGSCGNDGFNRVGPASTALRKIVSKYCPKTMQPEYP